MILDLPIAEYHKRGEVSSTLLKAIMISPAHLETMLKNGFPKTKSLILGDALHAAILEPKRFDSMYEKTYDIYKKNINGHKVGDSKLDEYGQPIVCYKHKEDSSMDISGEECRKLEAMIDAFNSSEEAKRLVDSAEYIEASFFFDMFRVRPDFITKDGWIVDVKTVGGMSDKPSAPENFNKGFFDFGYDIQMFMYDNVVRRELPNIKGFKFLCFDAKVPSGVQIYTFVNGESKWFELGGYRFHEALKRLKEYKLTDKHKVYDNETPDDLPLSYQAEDYLVRMRNE